MQTIQNICTRAPWVWKWECGFCGAGSWSAHARNFNCGAHFMDAFRIDNTSCFVSHATVRAIQKRLWLWRWKLVRLHGTSEVRLMHTKSEIKRYFRNCFDSSTTHNWCISHNRRRKSQNRSTARVVPIDDASAGSKSDYVSSDSAVVRIVVAPKRFAPNSLIKWFAWTRRYRRHRRLAPPY